MVSVRIVAADAGIEEAKRRLQEGRLVAFPTETVYGLGANALDANAVARIFEAKGRPSTNPIIVHIENGIAAQTLVSNWPETAERLARAFWPGPLTLVLEKTNAVPPIVTAGGSTVGLRVPNHPIALELLCQTGLPLAAPSANRSEEVSPTTAQHVADSLAPYVEDLLILDGGECKVGIESTVIDVTVTPCHVLRPGMVTNDMLRDVLGILDMDDKANPIVRSPGQMRRHYAPSVPVTLLPSLVLRDMEFQREDGFILLDTEGGTSGKNMLLNPRPDRVISLPPDSEVYARRLYSALRDLEARGVTRIFIEEPPMEPSWFALHDRLRRAATPKEGIG